MVYNNSAKRNGGSAMPDVILRKCGGCSETIEINRNSIADVLYYKNKYYHSQCFCEIAEKRSKTKRSTAVEWQTALDNLCELEADTKKMLEIAWVKDDLNEWLLSNYDIAAVPSRFWQIVADLERGIYKGKKCKPVTMETLLGAWKWGQRKLNSINRSNKMKKSGPQSDDARISYDLAILVQKVPIFLDYQEKQKAAEMERQRTLKEVMKIDYSKIASSTKASSNNLQDISSLVDDIF
jgi:hypothetical protein